MERRISRSRKLNDDCVGRWPERIKGREKVKKARKLLTIVRHYRMQLTGFSFISNGWSLTCFFCWKNTLRSMGNWIELRGRRFEWGFEGVLQLRLEIHINFHVCLMTLDHRQNAIKNLLSLKKLPLSFTSSGPATWNCVALNLKLTVKTSVSCSSAMLFGLLFSLFSP